VIITRKKQGNSKIPPNASEILSNIMRGSLFGDTIKQGAHQILKTESFI
jgi:hypothetical protein